MMGPRESVPGWREDQGRERHQPWSAGEAATGKTTEQASSGGQRRHYKGWERGSGGLVHPLPHAPSFSSFFQLPFWLTLLPPSSPLTQL